MEPPKKSVALEPPKKPRALELCSTYLATRGDVWSAAFTPTAPMQSGADILQKLKPGQSIAHMGNGLVQMYPTGLTEKEFNQALKAGLQEFSGKERFLPPAFTTLTKTMEQLVPYEGLSPEALRVMHPFLLKFVGVSDGAISHMMRHGVLAPLLRIAKLTSVDATDPPIIRNPFLAHLLNPHRPLDSEGFLHSVLIGQGNLLIGATGVHRATLVLEDGFGHELPDGLGSRAIAIHRLAPAVCEALAALGLATFFFPVYAPFFGGGETAANGSVQFPPLHQGLSKYFFKAEDLVDATYEHLVEYLRQNGYPRWLNIFGRPQDRSAVGGRPYKDTTKMAVQRSRKRSLMHVWTVVGQKGNNFVYRMTDAPSAKRLRAEV
jgi:hypothetical protein